MMNQEEALKILSLESGASTEDIKISASKKSDEIKEKISCAPTEALKTKFQQLLDKITAAEKTLTPAPVAKSRSPLSETKMADLPGMREATETNVQLEAGQVLAGRYTIEEQIGVGGMGAVYSAKDSNTGESIAIKLLLPELLKNPRAQERFLNEARISQKLSHPNIVNVYDVQQDGDYYFLTMELLEGQDLRAYLDNLKLSRQEISQDEALRIVNAICDGLFYAHDYTVHRDIKPENIWLTGDGQVKVMDFGIAQIQSTSQRTQTGAAMGTAYYMAPEQLQGRTDIDGRADQYAIGVLLYEMLSGQVPAGRVESLHQLNKAIGKKLSLTVDKLLSGQAEQRFSSIKELKEALEGGKGSGVSLPDLPLKTMGIAAGVIGAVILLIVLGGNGAFSNLDGLLPESAEVIAAKKAEVAKLQGEIKTYKQRLENGRRQLSSDLRDASRNNSSDELALEHWQTLTDNFIFNGSSITDLEGDLSMGESLLRDDGFEQAKVTLTKVRDGYKNLWEQFNAAESLLAVTQSMEKSKARWAKRKNAYGFTNPAQVEVARQNESKAASVEKEGDFSKSLALMKAAEFNWGEAFISVNGAVEVMDVANQKNAVAAATAKRKNEAKAKAIVENNRKRKVILEKKIKVDALNKNIEGLLLGLNSSLSKSYKTIYSQNGGYKNENSLSQSITFDQKNNIIVVSIIGEVKTSIKSTRETRNRSVNCMFKYPLKDFSERSRSIDKEISAISNDYQFYDAGAGRYASDSCGVKNTFGFKNPVTSMDLYLKKSLIGNFVKNWKKLQGEVNKLLRLNG